MATPTTVTVRVIAKAGKFLGADIAGALVTIHDAQTGELLASGNTQGGSGPADLMSVAITRLQTLPTDGASFFTTVLHLNAPRLIKVTARGPNGSLQSANTVSATQWVVPGKDITGGTGLLLEIPGMQVQIQEPATHLSVTGNIPYSVKILANVTMMCGCPIAKDTVWLPSLFDIGALVRELDIDNSGVDTPFSPITLKFTGITSQFAGEYKFSPSKFPAYYELIVFAFQPSNGNSGMDRVTFFVS
jgi:hypothetical protein